MQVRLRAVPGLLKEALYDFFGDDCPTNAAALSYYTIFSLAPLLVLLILLAGFIFDPRDVQGAIEAQVRDLIGPKGAQEVRAMLAHRDPPGTNLTIRTIVGIGLLLFGATGAFVQLQGALNKAWEVEPDPAQNQIRNFLMKRLFSFAMILGVVFLMLVSLALTAALSSLGEYVGGGLPRWLFLALNFALSFAVITTLFAAMFKIMPDAVVAWRDVWIGAIVTALLFVVGKFLLGYYLGRTDPAGAFGAAGSLALILIWVYYASMIVLFGAELTQAWIVRFGRGIKPEKGATIVVERKERVRTKADKRRAQAEGNA